MNEQDFTDMLEARLRLAYHDVAITTPRRRDDVPRLRRAVRVPALLATPVLALFSVAVVAGASTVAKTVVTGDPNPLDWGPRHALSAPAAPPGMAQPVAAPASHAGSAAGTGRDRPTPHSGAARGDKGGGNENGNGSDHGKAIDNGHGNGNGNGNGNGEPGSHGNDGPGSNAAGPGDSNADPGSNPASHHDDHGNAAAHAVSTAARA